MERDTPKTIGLMGEKLNPVEPASGATEETWSCLPTLLVWMIKERLGCADNLRLALVCRNWWLASKSYVKEVRSAMDTLPWIMQWVTDSANSTSREFIHVPTGDKFTLDMPEFYGCSPKFSKKGWILLLQKNVAGLTSASVFLVNPFKKAKIKMPEVEHPRFDFYVGCFTTTMEGCPQRVVLLRQHKKNGLTLSIANTSDETWTHKYFDSDTQLDFNIVAGVLIVGEDVYCFGQKGRLIIYKGTSNSWKELVGPQDLRATYAAVECEGQIIMFEIMYDRFIRDDRMSISRYNDTTNEWDSVTSTDLKDTSLFMQEYTYSFSARGKGSNAFFLEFRRLYNTVVKLCNLEDGSKKDLHWFKRSATWVDAPCGM